MIKSKLGNLKNQQNDNLIVVELKELKNNEFMVTLSNDKVLILSIDEILKYRLVKGKELTEDTLNDVVDSHGIYECYKKAISYIGSNLKCTFQIKEYLKKKDFDNQVVNDTIDLLIENKIIDDEMFKREYVNYLISTPMGRNMIEYKLSGLKLDTSFELDLDEYYDLAFSLCLRQLKNYQKYDSRDRKLKIKKFLFQKGYSYSDIDIIIRRLSNEFED